MANTESTCINILSINLLMNLVYHLIINQSSLVSFVSEELGEYQAY